MPHSPHNNVICGEISESYELSALTVGGTAVDLDTDATANSDGSYTYTFKVEAATEVTATFSEVAVVADRLPDSYDTASLTSIAVNAEQAYDSGSAQTELDTDVTYNGANKSYTELTSTTAYERESSINATLSDGLQTAVPKTVYFTFDFNLSDGDVLQTVPTGGGITTNESPTTSYVARDGAISINNATSGSTGISVSEGTVTLSGQVTNTASGTLSTDTWYKAVMSGTRTAAGCMTEYTLNIYEVGDDDTVGTTPVFTATLSGRNTDKSVSHFHFSAYNGTPEIDNAYAYTDPYYTATVKVADSESAAISDAVVTITSSDGTVTYAEATESTETAGTYTASVLAGTYNVSVTSNDYANSTTNELTVASDGDNSVAVTLADQEITTVEITELESYQVAIDSDLELSATVCDQDGNAISGETVTWSIAAADTEAVDTDADYIEIDASTGVVSATDAAAAVTKGTFAYTVTATASDGTTAATQDVTLKIGTAATLTLAYTADDGTTTVGDAETVEFTDGLYVGDEVTLDDLADYLVTLKLTNASDSSLIDVYTTDGTVIDEDGTEVTATAPLTIAAAATTVYVVVDAEGTFYYYEDYESYSAIGDTGWTSPNYSDGLTLETGNTTYGNYVNMYDGTQTGREAYLAVPTAAQVSGDYIVEFDASMTQGNYTDNTRTQTAIALGSTAVTSTYNYVYPSNYIFGIALDNSGLATTGVTVSGMDENNTATFANSTWYHYTLTVDSSEGTVDIAITSTDGNNTTMFSGTATIDGSSTVLGRIQIVGGRQYGSVAIDNISVAPVTE